MVIILWWPGCRCNGKSFKSGNDLQVQVEFLLGLPLEYQSSTFKLGYSTKLVELLNFFHNDKCFTSPLSIAHRKLDFLQAKVHSLMNEIL